MTTDIDPDALRNLARKWQEEAESIRPDVDPVHGYDDSDERENDALADMLDEHADALLVLVGDREDSSSASRQHYIDTGRHLSTGPACSECDESAEVLAYGMCASCLHNARRSGWDPGQ